MQIGPAEPGRGALEPLGLVVDPSEDLRPGILPDGSVVFSSDRSGNLDVWLRKPDGVLRRLTRHSASDFAPAPSPDGHSIAFVSTRSDAKGDIMLMGPDGGGMRNLGDAALAEDWPAWFPSGDRIAFSATDKKGGRKIMLLDLRSAATKPIVEGALQPAVSPDGTLLAYVTASRDNAGSAPCIWLYDLTTSERLPATECRRPEGYPAWRTVGGKLQLLFSRFEDDSDGNGRIDLADRPSLWVAGVERGPDGRPAVSVALPLTDGTSADVQPVASARTVLFASALPGRDFDIHAMDVPAEPSLDCPAALAKAAEATSPQRALMYVRRARRHADERCSLFEAEMLLRMGMHRQAAQAFAELAKRARSGRIGHRARLGQISATLENQLPIGMSPAQRRQRLRTGESLLAELDRLDVDPSLRQLVRADILRRLGRFDQGLAILKSLSDEADPDVASRAALMTGQVLVLLGMEEAAEEIFLDVAARGENPLLRQKGLRLLLDALDGDDEGERLRKLQKLFEKAKGAPNVRQRLLVEMARINESQGRVDGARLALLQAAELAPRSNLAVNVYLELSRLAERQGMVEDAAAYLTSLKARRDLDPKLERELNERLLGLKLARLRHVASAGKVAFALQLADEAVAEFPHSVRAWREWLELMDAAGRQAEALQRVRSLAGGSRDEALGQYLLGLALTYVDPPRNFDRAVEHLQNAAKLNPDSPFPHQTLGWLHEQLATLEADPDHLPEAAGHYERALEALGAKARLEDKADLWLDLGNVYLKLGNFELALRYLEKRGLCPLGFRRGERKLLFVRNWARAAFLAEKFHKAAELYGRAAKLADELVLPAWRARLLEAEAASLQLAGDHARAAARFGEACSLIGKDRLHWARCTRSQGYNLVMAGRFREAVDLLRRARRIFARRAATERRGANIDVGMSAESSRAPLGFSASQELVFVDTMIARAMREMGDWPGAVAAQNRKFAALKGMLYRLDDERLWLDVALAATGSMRDWLVLGRTGMAMQAAREALKAAGATGQGTALAVAASNMMELELARGAGGSGRDAAGLEEQLARAVDMLEIEHVDFTLAARTMGNLAVLLARRCGAAAASSGDRDVDKAIEHRIVMLDSCLAAAAKAEGLLRRAKAIGGRIGGLDGMRVKALACVNLARLYRLLGRHQEAGLQYAEAERLVEEGVLARVSWRFGPPKERAESLAALPPSVAGCPASAMMCRERDRLFERLVSSAAGKGKVEDAFRWMEQWALLRRRDRLWTDLDKLDGEAARWKGETEKLVAEFESMEKALPPPDMRAQWRAKRFRLLEQMGRKIHEAGSRASWLGALAGGTPARLDDVRRSLRPGWVLLEAAPLAGKTVLVAIAENEARLFDVSLSREELDRLTRQAGGKASDDAQRTLERLGRLLLGPTRKLLERCRGIVVADGLASIPWEVLRFEQRPLLALVPVVRVYSASDLPAWKGNSNLNYSGLLWVGTASSGIESAVGLAFGRIDACRRFDDCVHAGLRPGLVVWDCDVLPNEQAFLSGRCEAGGAAGGEIRIHQAAGFAPAAAAWFFTRTGTTPSVVTALDAAALAAGTSTVVLAGSVDHVSVLVKGMKDKPVYRAIVELAASLERRGEGSESLMGLQLRGMPGIEPAARRELAKRRWRKVLSAAVRAMRSRRWQRALAGFAAVYSMGRMLGSSVVAEAAAGGMVKAAVELGRFDLAARAQGLIIESAKRRGDEMALAAGLRQLGIVLGKKGSHAKAAEHLNRAVDSFERLGRTKEEAETRALLAVELDRAGQYARSVEQAELARLGFEKLGNWRRQAEMLRLMASTRLLRLHDVDEARRLYLAAGRLAAEHGDGFLAAYIELELARCDLAASLYRAALSRAQEVARGSAAKEEPAIRAEALLQQAKALWYMGDYLRASDVLERFLGIVRKTGRVKLEISGLSLVGLVRLALGSSNGAERALRRALEIAERNGLEREQASQLNNLGVVLGRQRRFEEALDVFFKARKIDERLGNLAGLAYDLRNQGLILLKMRALERAKELLERALRLSRKVGDDFNTAQCLCGLAWVEMKRGHRGEAAAYARQALRLAAQARLAEIVWKSEQVLGLLAESEGQVGQALRHYQTAMAVLEKLPAGGANAGTELLGDKDRVYKRAVWILAGEGRAAEALVAAERHVAETTGGWLAPFLQGLEDSRLKSLAEQLEQRRHERLERLMKELAKDPASAGGRYRDGRYEELARSIAVELPGAEGVFGGWVASPQAVEGVLGSRQALVVLYPAEQGVVAWLVRRDGSRVRATELGAGELQELVELSAGQVTGGLPARRSLSRLYTLLVQPFESEMTDIEEIGIVASGVLASVPYAALVTPRGKYWYEEKLLFGCHSLNLFLIVAMRNKRAMFGPAVVVEGEPAPEFAALEAEAVERLVPGSVVLRHVPDIARISEAIRAAAMLHVVAHTSAGRSALQGRRLLLGPKESGGIGIRAILALPAVPEMVVLSGCSTATGDENGLGLARAFLSRGAMLVLGTRWEVSGAAGSMLVKRFYRELGRHGPLVALRKAMDVTRRYYSHPMYWGGFTLMGYGFRR